MTLLNTVNTCVFYNYSVLIGAWIVTGGRHYGVMKHVEEAVRDYTIASANKKPLIAIGIVTWGCINNRKVLVSNKVCVAAADIGRLLPKHLICFHLNAFTLWLALSVFKNLYIILHLSHGLTFCLPLSSSVVTLTFHSIFIGSNSPYCIYFGASGDVFRL